MRIPAAVADGLWSALQACSSVTATYTMAAIQASFANAAEFFTAEGIKSTIPIKPSAELLT